MSFFPEVLGNQDFALGNFSGDFEGLIEGAADFRVGSVFVLDFFGFNPFSLAPPEVGQGLNEVEEFMFSSHVARFSTLATYWTLGRLGVVVAS